MTNYKDSNTKVRLSTGILLGLLVTWVVFNLEHSIFNLVVAVVLILASWEWSYISGIESNSERIFYTSIVTMIIYVTSFYPTATLWASAIFWGSICFLLYTYQKAVRYCRMFCLIIGILAVVPFFISMSLLHSKSPSLVLFVMIVVVTSDSSAYFFGKKYGKVKFSPIISPNKTLEGFLASILLGGIAGIMSSFLIFKNVSHCTFIFLIVFSFVLPIVAAIGDLLESMMKRQRMIKDSGNILPGHGGILDRLDSMLPSMPIFTLLGILLGLIIV